MANPIVQKIEEHPVITSIILGIAALGIAIIFANRAANAQNTATGVPTDAAGNPLTGGIGVSPTLSNTDLQAEFQDLQQQILNWEQQFQQTNGNGSPSTLPAPPASYITPKDANPSNLGSILKTLQSKYNLGNITQQDIWAANPSLNPLNVGRNTLINIPTTPPTNWWQNILTGIKGTGQGSYYKTPQAETLQQLANLWGLGPTGWQGLYFNSANNQQNGLNLKQLAKQQGLSGASGKQANLLVPAGTEIYITTSGIEVG